MLASGWQMTSLSLCFIWHSLWWMKTVHVLFPVKVSPKKFWNSATPYQYLCTELWGVCIQCSIKFPVLDYSRLILPLEQSSSPCGISVVCKISIWYIMWGCWSYVAVCSPVTWICAYIDACGLQSSYGRCFNCIHYLRRVLPWGCHQESKQQVRLLGTAFEDQWGKQRDL